MVIIISPAHSDTVQRQKVFSGVKSWFKDGEMRRPALVLGTQGLWQFQLLEPRPQYKQLGVEVKTGGEGSKSCNIIGYY